jgi:protein O-GlcNAc transferase
MTTETTALAPLIDRAFAQLRQMLPSQALVTFEHALQLDPRSIEALVGGISALLRLGRPRDALPFCERVRRLQPAAAEAYANCAAVFLALKRPGEALICCDHALTRQWDMFQAHYNRAEALLALGRPEAALEAYERTLAVQPAFAAAHCGHGHACREMGNQDAALESYDRALALAPQLSAARVGRLLAMIPVIPVSSEEIERSRDAFATELAGLQHRLAIAGSVDALGVVGVAQPFALAYQQRPNKALLMQWGGLCAGMMQRWATGRIEPLRCPADFQADPRVRLGIVTAQLREHSVYTALLKGWLDRLDRTRVDISVFNIGKAQDAAAAAARANARLIDCADRSLIETVAAICARDVEVLIYPEIGMDPMTVQLASLRLAPHQVAAWGHPETSGLPTIDHYLSAAAFEPPEAQQYYSEQLVRLPGIGCYYEPLGIRGEELDLRALGIAPAVPLLLCAGTPYKYAPEHDDVLVEIARRLSHCQLAFFQSKSTSLNARLLTRLRRRFRAGGLDPDQYLILVPWLAPTAFFALLRRADVYLDTIGFSGFNTVMQAVECALPIVAFEGRFMRGRFASGVLRAIGLDELVATGGEQYAQLAVRLARDELYRNEIRQRLRDRQYSLYRDQTAIDGLSRFIAGLKPGTSPAAAVPSGCG